MFGEFRFSGVDRTGTSPWPHSTRGLCLLASVLQTLTEGNYTYLHLRVHSLLDLPNSTHEPEEEEDGEVWREGGGKPEYPIEGKTCDKTGTSPDNI